MPAVSIQVAEPQETGPETRRVERELGRPPQGAVGPGPMKRGTLHSGCAAFPHVLPLDARLWLWPQDPVHSRILEVPEGPCS